MFFWKKNVYVLIARESDHEEGGWGEHTVCMRKVQFQKVCTIVYNCIMHQWHRETASQIDKAFVLV